MANPALMLLFLCGSAVMTTGARVKQHSPGGRGPRLHLFSPMSATDLSDAAGYWSVGDGMSLCEEGVIHEGITCAMEGMPGCLSKATRDLAERLNEALANATLPASESDVTGRVIVISNPGKNAKEACLKALAIKQQTRGKFPGNDGTPTVQLWEQSTIESRNFSTRKQFWYDGSDEDYQNRDEGTEDDIKIERTTTIMAESLTDQFEFNFLETVTVAPVVYGGYTEDGSIVGVLSMRVWT